MSKIADVSKEYFLVNKKGHCKNALMIIGGLYMIMFSRHCTIIFPQAVWRNSIRHWKYKFWSVKLCSNWCTEGVFFIFSKTACISSNHSEYYKTITLGALCQVLVAHKNLVERRNRIRKDKSRNNGLWCFTCMCTQGCCCVHHHEIRLSVAFKC